MSMDDPAEETKQEALTFLREQGAWFTHLMSNQGLDAAIVDTLEIDGAAIPHYKVYDRQGQLVAKFSRDDDAGNDDFTHADIEVAIRKALGL